VIRPEPGSFEELMRELLVERFGPGREIRREHVDSPAEIRARRKVLLEMPADDASGDGKVVPLRRPQKRRAAA
jgi:hypothetical protein